MFGYRDHRIKNAFTPSKNHCPYFKYSDLLCPFNYEYRQKAEEFPIQQQAPPKNPPPNYTPKISDVAEATLTAVEFGAITPCIFRNTYLWLKNGESFWSYIVYIGRSSISGWRYKSGQWVYFGIELKQLKNFICS